MLQLLRTPTVAFLTFLVGTVSFATTLRANIVTTTFRAEAVKVLPGGSSSSQGSEKNTLPSCGNAILEEQEQCDDGNTDNTDACTNFCKLAHCGDGILHVRMKEECDNGYLNGTPGNNCGLDCKKMHTQGRSSLSYESSSQSSRSNAHCGNGKKEDGEDCDDGNTDDTDECTMMCKKSRCGDGIAQFRLGEQCDEGESNGKDGLCTKECKKPHIGEPTASCGNGNKESGEDCDDGNNDNADECSNRCKIAICGDSVVQRWEECDLGRSNGIYECSYECRKLDGASASSVMGGGVINIGNPPPLPSSFSSAPIDQSSPMSENNEAWLRVIEEAKKRAEEDQKRLQEQMEEQRKMQGFMGCFNVAGEWTFNRSECDTNQREHLKEQVVEINENIRQEVIPVPVQTVPEEKVREEIREKLLGDNIAEEHRNDLLNVLEEAKRKITLLTGQEFAPEVSDYLTRAIEWLDQGVVYFSSGSRSQEEIRLMNQPVRDLMQQVSDLVASQKNLPKDLPKIDPIVEKTEMLVNKFRNAFILLAQSGIGLDQSSLQAYVDAAQRFAEMKPACIDHRTSCEAINDVLENLKLARPWLEDQLNAHPDIAKKIQ